MALILYQRDDCPLCDQALAVLAEAHAPDFRTVWIEDEPLLELRYGDRVPVLYCDIRKLELCWPFDAGTVHAFVRDTWQM